MIEIELACPVCGRRILVTLLAIVLGAFVYALKKRRFEMTEKEKATFAGIPIPLTIKTILNAYDGTLDWLEILDENTSSYKRAERQRDAFRARILWMDAEKDRQIEEWETYHGFYIGDVDFVETMADKDKRIKELEHYLDEWDRIVGDTPAGDTYHDYVEPFLSEGKDD